MMDKLTRGRRPVRSQLTRIVNEVTTALSGEDIDIKALRVSYGLLEKTAADLEVWDNKVREQLLDDGATDDVVDKEFSTMDEYTRNYLSIKTDIDEYLSREEPVARSESASVVGDSKRRKFHLPEVKLKSFGGELKDWLGWWSQFEKIHLDEELHDTDKFQYLAQCMEAGSDAKQIVDSYPQTEGNYANAIEALKDQFGRPDLLLQVYVRELLTLVIGNVTSNTKLPLPQLYVRLESHLRSLAELNLDKADPDAWLFPLVESSLSVEVRRLWQHSSENKTDGASLNPRKSKLKLLMSFIKSEVQNEQQVSLGGSGFNLGSNNATSCAPNRKFSRKPRPSFTRQRDEIPTAAGLINLQSNGCGFCGKSHDTEKCFRAQKMTTEEKRRAIREKKLCFKCLSSGHIRRNCKKVVKCGLCSGQHHPIMCANAEQDKIGVKRDSFAPLSNLPFKIRRTESEQKEEDLPTTSTFHQSSNMCSKTVLMNTLKVKVAGRNGKMLIVRLVGDNGSQRSYVSNDIIDKANCTFVDDEWLQNILFGGNMTAPKKFPRHEITIIGVNGCSMKLELLGKDQLTGEIGEVPPGPWLNELSRNGVTLTDIGDESSTADILIGNNYWGAIRTGKMFKLSGGLVAEETVFGWTLGGPIIPSKISSTMVSTMTVCTQNVENLWKLEAIGIRDPVDVQTAQAAEIEALAHFTDTVKREKDGRYVVSLPWRSSDFVLPSNRMIAEQRLRSTTWKLKRNGKFKDYHNVFRTWELEELIVRVDDNASGGHFIPHRPVFKESPTTPVRPVFDASCRQGRSSSLNDCLHKGPNLIELIPAMLLRFGENRIGISADVRKAFQMIKVREEDQPFQRFLWWEDESCSKMVLYQHLRVVFGMTCSPFLLGATIYDLLDKLEDKVLAAKLKSSFYCDNLVSSVSTFKEYTVLKSMSTTTLADAKMELRQWACTLLDGDRTEKIIHESSAEYFDGVIMPVLGLLWNREDDTLTCVIKELELEKITKRYMLSVVAQVFDPMGFLCPAMILPKLLVQESWSSKLGWDSEVPAEAEKKFLKWKDELIRLKQVKVPRFNQILNSTSRVVHVFSDSSMNAMAAVAFLRTELNGSVAVQFLMAKSRLTPVKKPTIPRAELVSCVIGVRVATCVREALELDIKRFWFWSDSTTALVWIKRNGDWGVFVKNRVDEILRSTSSDQWRHVPGQMNPADLSSRGCTPNALLKCKWWTGPTWLCLCESEFPNLEPTADEHEVCKEKKKATFSMNVSTSYATPTFSSYRKNVAVWGWVIRFIGRCRGLSEKRKFLTIEEMRKAEKVVLRSIQEQAFSLKGSEIGGIKIFKDCEDVYRVKTRLTNRNDTSEFIFPVLLPKSHPLVDMLILDMHKYHGHGGVQFLVSKLREKYWILQSRRAIRKVLRRCVACRRYTSQKLEVDPAALPSRRVEDAQPFSTTGVDLAGPLFLKDGQKAWIVLYTCALYRAVHLDIVTSLSTEDFLRSLERFISIFGRPNTVYSDNGTNFVGAANLFKMIKWEEVQRKCGVMQIQWIFNPPTAAWWGGFWERLVRSVKDLLKRMLGRAKLSYDELRTCLAGVAATINDRPLTLVTEDNDDMIPLTPAMFIRSPLMGHFPELEGSSYMQKSYMRMKDTQLRLQHRFRKEYLSQLVTRVGRKQQSSIKPDDVVLVGADNRKRFEWPLGRVIELLPGRDGKVRVVRVKTANGILLRPIQRLYPLEISQEPVFSLKKRDGGPVTSKSNTDVVTQRGRLVKQPVRYGKWTG